MSWNIKIPFRSPYDPLDPGTIYELTADLDSEDRAVTRELFTQLKMEGATTVAHAIHGMKSLDAPKRRRLLNWLRHACGLKSTDDVEAEERFERANAAARAVVASAFQSCPACGSIPTDEIGAWRPVNVKRWWCEAHRDQAQPGDMDVR
jgi:hypothetical protein